MALHIGLTRTTDSNSLFEDATGADVQASMERFDAMLLDAISERFPTATVEICDRGFIFDLDVDSQIANPEDTADTLEAQNAISEIADDIHGSGDWCVEV